MRADLLNLLAAGRAGASPVAVGAGGVRTWEDFLRAAGAAARRARGGGRWLLACADPFAFGAGLMGLALAGAVPLIPPSLLPRALDGLPTDGRLEDADLLAADGPPAPEAPLPDAPLEFWTSGSTGAPKPVRRTLGQMAREVAILEALFGQRLGTAPVAATVPHFHIYGCLFRILWPLASGRPFVTEVCGGAAEFRAELTALGRPTLVSSPAHLSRLPRLVDLAGLELPAVFSSGGPLAREDALAWRAASRGGVVEIFGSTETGGIGWRNPGPEPESSRWTPFPDVALALAEDGALLLRSSRVEDSPARMEDAAELAPDGSFTLLGRLDRIVKLQEKRVSLPQVEAALAAAPGVRGAAVILLEGRRPCLGAVVAVESLPAGAQGRRARSEALRAHLATTLEGPALPRKWRFLEELPRDARGKLSAAHLASLFDGDGITAGLELP